MMVSPMMVVAMMVVPTIVAPMVMPPMMLEEVVVAAIVVIVVVMSSTIIVTDCLHQACRRFDALHRQGGRRLGRQCRRGKAHEPAHYRGNESVLHQLFSLLFFSPAWHLGAHSEAVAMNWL
jgi:hypothetical protein